MDQKIAKETLEILRSGERPKWLVPTKIFDKNHEWRCCHVGCEKLADVVISGDESYEDYTHMCNDHKDEYLGDYNNVEIEEIIRIEVRNPMDMSMTPEQEPAESGRSDIHPDDMIEQLLAEVKRLTSELERKSGALDDMFQNREKWRESHMQLEAEVRAKDAEIEKLTAQRNQAQHDRWQYEKGTAEIHSQLSEAIRILEWYADETNWIQGRYEGGVFFAKIEDDRGSHARIALDRVQSQVSKE